jgi:hypothetical protein
LECTQDFILGYFSAVPSGLDWQWFFVKFDKIRSFWAIWGVGNAARAGAKYCSLRRNVQVRREAGGNLKKKSRRAG